MDIPVLFDTKEAELCRLLTWDTEFFGKRIGLIQTNYLAPERVQTIDAWTRENQMDCLYFLANTDSPASVRAAEDNGFRFQSVRTWIERKLDDSLHAITLPPVDGVTLRTARLDDLNALRPIARNAYTWTRFYSDPNFTQAQCEQLYDIWLTRSIRREIADEVVVVEQDGAPVGYMTCKLPSDPTNTEGLMMLLGVNDEKRGSKLGQRVVVEALWWFARQGMTTAALATQGHNAAVMRFYQRLGFTTRSVQFWYHKWYTTHT